MSTILGILQRDGSPVDKDNLWKMTRAVAFRGADWQGIWADEWVGLGQGILATSPESKRDRQIHCLDNQLWISADVRLDAREDLIAKIEQDFRTDARFFSDTELLLYAWKLWGEACVEHLSGDFAFAIWDKSQQKLFCARDHFGLRPFVYYLCEKFFAFASSEHGLFAHPAVPRSINEERLADYLFMALEGRDKQSSFYKDVFRLPPAHTLVIEANQVRIRQYWHLEAAEPLQLASDAEYAEAYRAELYRAVHSRLRTAAPEQLGIMLSGGLDSAAVTGISWKIAQAENLQGIKTFSAVADEGEANVETRHILSMRRYTGFEARLIAPSQVMTYLEDLRQLFSRNSNLFSTNMEIPLLQYIEAKRSGVKVMLDGVFGDELVAAAPRYMGYLFQQGKWLEALREIRDYCRFYDLPPSHFASWLIKRLKTALIPQFIYQWKERLIGEKQFRRELEAAGIRLDFAEKHGLYAKSRRLNEELKAQNLMNFRVQWLNHASITAAVERYEHMAALQGIEVRHPYLDKRLVEFCMRLPLNQLTRGGWSKIMVRNALRSDLPEDVLWRKGKTDLAIAFIQERHRLEQIAMKDTLEIMKMAIEIFVNIDKVQEALVSYSVKSIPDNIIWRSYCLSLWLLAQKELKTRSYHRESGI